MSDTTGAEFTPPPPGWRADLAAVERMTGRGPVDDAQAADMESVRCAAGALLQTILEKVPPCGDRDEAVRAARQAAFFARAAVAHRGAF